MNAYYEHRDSYQELIGSATDGCGLCAIIIYSIKNSIISALSAQWVGRTWESAILDIENDSEDTSIKMAIDAEHLYDNRKIEEVVQFDTVLVQVGKPMDKGAQEYDGTTNEDIPPLRLRITVPRGQSKSLMGFKIGSSDLDADLGSDWNHLLTKTWLEECYTQHKRCPIYIPTELPTRVLDVRTEGSGDPRLLITRGAVAKYVALSHCWGGKITPLLTSESLETFQEAIAFSELPANFRDAICITRKLGLRYLWIDSLCIIQDSKLDWEIEAKKMGNVYRYSYVTISAAVAKSSTVGILSNAWTKSSGEIPSPVEIPLGTDPKDYVTLGIMNNDDESLRDLFAESPLNSRGWTLQETVLSPRILHYGAHQIHWQCPSGFKSADGIPCTGNRMPDYEAYPTISHYLYSDLPNLAVPDPSLPQASIDKILEEYYHLVKEYSDRTLTFGSDKLPAFSGLAQLIHKAVGGTYLAGLWSSDIHQGLSWFGDVGSAVHQNPYRAPSWSRAVTDAPIIFYEVSRKSELEEYDARLVAHSIENGSNPYGEVTAASLTLEGLTKPFFRSWQVMKGRMVSHSMDQVHFDDLEREGKSYGANQVIKVDNDFGGFLLSMLPGEWQIEEWDRDFDPELFSDEFYKVLMVDMRVIEGIELPRRGYGLLLKYADSMGGDEEIWQRAGLVSFACEEGTDFREWIDTWTRETLVLV